MSEHGTDLFENGSFNLLQHVTQSKSTDYAKLYNCEPLTNEQSGHINL